VVCPGCGHEGRSGARFCEGCGTALPRRCPACGAELSVGARFCSACGAPVAGPITSAATVTGTASGLAPRGEHKQVSVLFADVVGSMVLAELLDPERLRAVMAELTRRCAECVTRFEGMVDKFTGDGIMALFGAPVAVEDHARRACYAGLEMQRSITAYATELRDADGIELGLRVGINSGEVIVGDIATAERFSYTAIGHTVGLAQRMEALAAPGSVYLSGHAARLAQGYLSLRELGPRQVKGSSRPIEVYELVGLGTARGHIDVARGRGLSRFVGRAGELRELSDALAHAQAGVGRSSESSQTPGWVRAGSSASSSKTYAGPGPSCTRHIARPMPVPCRWCPCWKCCVPTSVSPTASPRMWLASAFRRGCSRSTSDLHPSSRWSSNFSRSRTRIGRWGASIRRRGGVGCWS